MRPKRSSERRTSSSFCSCPARSPGTARASEPTRSISSTATLRPSSPRAATTTFAPRSPAARAIARPTPLDAPVTTITCSPIGFLRTRGFGCRVAPLRNARYPRFMPNVGPLEIVGLLLLALLLFGAKRLPEIGRSLGRGMREFKDSIAGKDDDDETPELTQSTTPAKTPAPPSQPREHDTVP